MPFKRGQMLKNFTAGANQDLSGSQHRATGVTLRLHAIAMVGLESTRSGGINSRSAESEFHLPF